MLGLVVAALALAVVGTGTFGSPAASGRCTTYAPALPLDPDVEVCGLVLATYVELGEADGPLRRPVQSETATDPSSARWGDQVTSFSGGGVYRDSRTGVVSIPGYWVPLAEVDLPR